jgi:hypothetical protein
VGTQLMSIVYTDDPTVASHGCLYALSSASSPRSAAFNTIATTTYKGSIAYQAGF